MLLRSNLLYVGPWWQTLLALRARPFAQTRLSAIAMRFAKDIRHNREDRLCHSQSILSQQWHPFCKKLIWQCHEWDGLKQKEAREDGVSANPSPYSCPFILSITFVSWSFRILIHYLLVYMMVDSISPWYQNVWRAPPMFTSTQNNVSPMLSLWSRSTLTDLFTWWCRGSANHSDHPPSVTNIMLIFLVHVVGAEANGTNFMLP